MLRAEGDRRGDHQASLFIGSGIAWFIGVLVRRRLEPWLPNADGEGVVLLAWLCPSARWSSPNALESRSLL